MSTMDAHLTAQDHWDSLRGRLAAVLDWFASIFERLAENWKLVVFNVVALPVLGIIYWTINSIGLRLTIPILATKVYKIPGLSVLRHYRDWRELDLANVTAIVLLLLVWEFSLRMFRLFMRGSVGLENVNEQFANSFIPIVGIVLVIIDAVMFYNGIGEQAGFLTGDGMSLMQVMLTLAYSAAILAVAFLHTVYENA